MTGTDSCRRVPAACCKPSEPPPQSDGMTRHVPAGSTLHVLNTSAMKPTPNQLSTCTTVDLLDRSWAGLLRPPWEPEIDLQRSRQQIICFVVSAFPTNTVEITVYTVECDYLCTTESISCHRRTFPGTQHRLRPTS